MRATRAYITSLGTTGMLIASALLTLSVMSAFVAFNGFPGQDVQAPIGSLLVHEAPPPVAVPAKPARSHASTTTRNGTAAATARHRSGHARAQTSPVAHTGPVVKRAPGAPPAQTQAPTSAAPQQAQQPAAAASPVTTSQPLSGTSPPILPTTGTPPLPEITVPPLGSPSAPPPQSSQLPIDTSGVTSLLGGQ